MYKNLASVGVALFSPVLANLYMQYYETELLPQISPSPPLWLRYVDDVILAWDQHTDFQGFLSQVNELTPSIKFTTEWKQDCSLPFLSIGKPRDFY